MARYVIGDRVARWIRSQMSDTPSSMGRNGDTFIQPSGVRPFTLRWSIEQDVVTAGFRGCWIIYIPWWALSIQGLEFPIYEQEMSESEQWVAADGYDDGWYRIPGGIGKDIYAIYLSMTDDGVVSFDTLPRDRAIFARLVAAVDYDAALGTLQVTQAMVGPIDIPAPRPFDIIKVNDDSGEQYLQLLNPVYRVGGKTYRDSSESSQVEVEDGILAAVLELDVEQRDHLSFIYYEDFDELADAEKDPSQFVLPLYQFANGTILLDLRSSPTVQAMEF